mgnify:CR=1 FL=1
MLCRLDRMDGESGRKVKKRSNHFHAEKINHKFYKILNVLSIFTQRIEQIVKWKDHNSKSLEKD